MLLALVDNALDGSIVQLFTGAEVELRPNLGAFAGCGYFEIR